MSFLRVDEGKYCPNCKSFDIIREEIKIMTIDLKDKLGSKSLNGYCRNCIVSEIINQNKILNIYKNYYKKVVKDIENYIIRNNNLLN